MIHKYIQQSISHVVGGLVDMLISYMYVCTCEICFWIYVPTCRNKCNWCTLKHLVLVRIKGLKKSPKIPRNTFSDALLKSQFPNFAANATQKKLRFARFFLAGVTGKNDAHLQLFFARNADSHHRVTVVAPRCHVDDHRGHHNIVIECVSEGPLGFQGYKDNHTDELNDQIYQYGWRKVLGVVNGWVARHLVRVALAPISVDVDALLQKG